MQMEYANITLRQATALQLCYCTVFPKQAMHGVINFPNLRRSTV
jgi:hypothetical protein